MEVIPTGETHLLIRFDEGEKARLLADILVGVNSILQDTCNNKCCDSSRTIAQRLANFARIIDAGKEPT